MEQGLQVGCQVKRLSHSVINWRSYQVEQGLQVGCQVKRLSHSVINWRSYQVEQGLQEGCQVKTVTFSHQLEIISGGARVAGGVPGKKTVTFRWSKGCRWDVG